MNAQLKNHALQIFKEALEAVNPRRCVLEHIKLTRSVLGIDDREYDLERYGSIFVIAFGKAASSMGKAVEEVLGGRITDGIVVSNSQPPFTFSKLKFYLSNHPIPDGRSLNAAKNIISILESAGENDLVIFLISGGGSSLLAMPAPGISMDDKSFFASCRHR